MRIERFVIEEREDVITNKYGKCVEIEYSCVIYDRVVKKDIVEIKTGHGGLNKELAESILTMLNIKYIGGREDN